MSLGGKQKPLNTIDMPKEEDTSNTQEPKKLAAAAKFVGMGGGMPKQEKKDVLKSAGDAVVQTQAPKSVKAGPKFMKMNSKIAFQPPAKPAAGKSAAAAAKNNKPKGKGKK